MTFIDYLRIFLRYIGLELHSDYVDIEQRLSDRINANNQWRIDYNKLSEKLKDNEESLYKANSTIEELQYEIQYLEKQSNLIKELQIVADRDARLFNLPSMDFRTSFGQFTEEPYFRISVMTKEKVVNYQLPKKEIVNKEKQPYLFKMLCRSIGDRFAVELSELIKQALTDFFSNNE